MSLQFHEWSYVRRTKVDGDILLYYLYVHGRSPIAEYHIDHVSLLISNGRGVLVEL